MANPAGDNQSAIQDLLDAHVGTICLTGIFNLTAPLTFGYNLTLFGLKGFHLLQCPPRRRGAVPILEDVTKTFSVSVQDLTFTFGNSTDYNLSGGITAGAVTATDSLFTRNRTVNDGGAILAQRGVNLTNTTFSLNHADDVGGAILTFGDILVDSAASAGMTRVAPAARLRHTGSPLASTARASTRTPQANSAARFRPSRH